MKGTQNHLHKTQKTHIMLVWDHFPSWRLILTTYAVFITVHGDRTIISGFQVVSEKPANMKQASLQKSLGISFRMKPSKNERLCLTYI